MQQGQWPSTQFQSGISCHGPQHPMVDPAQVYISQSCSPAMQNLFPGIVLSLVNAIQADAAQNPARTFLFNEMASGGYQNPNFYDLAAKTTELSELALMVHGQQMGVSEIIAEVVRRMVRFRSVFNLQKYPELAQQMGPAGLQEAAPIIAEFERFASGLEMALSQQAGGFQRQQPQQQHMGNWQQAANAMMQNTQGLNNDWRKQGQQFRQPAQQAQPQRTWARSASEQTKPAEVPRTTASWRRSATVLASTEKVEPTPDPRILPVTKTVQAPAKQADTATSFMRSNKVPYDSVYDHNLYEKVYVKKEELIEDIPVTYSQPMVKRKEKPMDREAHLGKPSFSKIRFDASKVVDADKRIREAEAEEGKYQLITVVGHVERYETTTNGEEEWTKLQALAQTKRSTTKRIICATQPTAYVQAMVSESDMVPFLDSMQHSDTPQEAVQLLRNELNDSSESLEDHLVLRTISTRLTERVNRFLAREAALPGIKITSYEDDAGELVDVLSKSFGESVKNAYLENHTKIVHEALRYIDDPEIKKSLDEDVLGEEVALDTVNLVHFVEYTGMTQVDLDSAEMRFDIPNPKVAAGVFEQSAPILSKVIDAVYEAYGQSSSGCTRHLLRSRDGVVFELDKGAFNKTFNLISIVK